MMFQAHPFSSFNICLSGLVRLSVVFAMVMFLSGCDLAPNMQKPDREAGMEMQDFRDGLSSRLPDVNDKSGASDMSSIPALQPYVASTSQSLKSMPLVSISINQSVPLKDALFELAHQAEYDLELDPRIRGAIIFTARNRPFDQVIEHISDIAGLRYAFSDRILRVELDTPYNKIYKIDYLSYIRTNASSVRNDIAVVSGDGADTGSSFEAKGESSADFWGELEVGLAQLLQAENQGQLRTSSDPRISVADTNPSNPNVETTLPAGQSGGNVTVQPPDAVLNVTSLPVEDTSMSGASGDGPLQTAPASFSLNKQAGLINVYATERAHGEVDAYLKALRRSVTAQVLIEAKILEVTLDDEYATGIDWRVLDFPSGEWAVNYLSNGAGALDAINGSLSSALPSTSTIQQGSNFVVGYGGSDVQSVIRAVSGFGTVRALASPRLTVLNNQSAVLNVATNQVFFEIDIDVTTNEGDTSTDIDSEIRNVPEGILVNVQPSIDLENQTVSLAVRPTITRITDQVQDPAIQFITASAGITGVQSLVPELNVQEIDSVIKVRSGQPIVMGGLLEDRTTTAQEGIPVLGEMPMVGGLFRQHNDIVQKTEIVIFLKASILESPGSTVDDTDRDIYRMFSSDRRPFKL